MADELWRRGALELAELIASGKVDLKPLISETFAFEDSKAAFDRAVEGRPSDVKLQIRVAK